VADDLRKMKNASPAFAGEAFSIVWGRHCFGGNNCWGFEDSTKATAETQLIFQFFLSSQNSRSFKV
jgi:hypothetical protein